MSNTGKSLLSIMLLIFFGVAALAYHRIFTPWSPGCVTIVAEDHRLVATDAQANIEKTLGIHSDCMILSDWDMQDLGWDKNSSFNLYVSGQGTNGVSWRTGMLYRHWDE